MMKSIPRCLWQNLCLLLVLVLCAFPPRLSAQVEWVKVNTLTTSSGLPADEVIDLHFARSGQLWVSTSLALASLSDNEWKVYTEVDGLPWEGTRLGRIFEDSKGNVWICSGEEKGLAKISPEGVITVLQTIEGNEQSLASNDVYDIVEDNQGGYFISNHEQFGTSLSYLSAEGTWEHYNFSVVGANPFDKILCMEYDSTSEVLYAGTLFSGVMYFDASEKVFKPVSTDYQTAVSELAISFDGHLYAAMDIGLLKVDLSSKRAVTLMTKENGLADNFVSSVAIDPRGTIWAGTDGAGVTCIALDGTITQYNTSNGISANAIPTITFDREGRAYVGTRIGGISYQDEAGKWKHIGSQGLAGNDVSSMLFVADDATWYGTSAGLSLYNGKIWHNFKLTQEDGTGLQRDAVTGLVWDQRPERNVLYVSGTGGIARYEPEADRWSYFPCDTTDEEGQKKPIRVKILQDAQGQFWVTTFGERLGIGKFDEETKSYTFFNDRNLPALPEGVHAFFTGVQAPDGSFWFCSVGGVLILKDGAFSFKRFPISIQIPDPDTGESRTGFDENVRNVAFDAEGRAWLSKLSGIVIYDPKTDTQIEEKGLESLPLSIVTKIVFDGAGNAFVGTFFDGLFLRTPDGKYYHLNEKYGLSDKLQITEIYLHNDRLYLCTDQGVMHTADYKSMIAQAVGNQRLDAPERQPLVFPNPAHDHILLPDHTTAYGIYDIHGRLLRSGYVEHERIVSIEALAPAVYLLRYCFEGEWVTEKLIVR